MALRLAALAVVLLAALPLGVAADGEAQVARLESPPTQPRGLGAAQRPDPFAEQLAAPPPAPAAASEAGYDVALMLLGSVAFVMSLFYLLHVHEDDLRAYAWNVVSASICTFTGVLIGTSWSRCFAFFVVGPPEVAGPYRTILCGMFASLGWYVVLQCALAVVAVAVGRRRKLELYKVRLNMKCFAMLFGITLGASSIGLWGLVQSLVPHNIGGTIGVLLACFFSMGFVFMVGGTVRTHYTKSDDDKTDEYEELWDEFTRETEDGALCMTLAHLCVQATRLSIMGQLPLPGGQMHPGESPTQRDVCWLVIFGFFYAALIPLLDFVLKVNLVSRFQVWMKRTAGFAAAFCFLYSITWATGSRVNVSQPPGQMVLALVVTLVGLVLIFFLDSLVDLQCTGETADREIKALIMPMSVLIGFGWKQAFVGAITAITVTEKFMPVPLATLTYTVALVVVVVPAWRLYILPEVMHQDLRKEAKKASLAGDGGGVATADGALGAPLLAQQPGASPAELVKQNEALLRRNADLEASIRGIRAELSELKQMAVLLR